MSVPSIRKTVWTLAPMAMALALAMDVYVPAVPHMATLFHVSAGQMQLTLSLFMFTCGIVQLVIGPLSDQYGRRRVSFFSIVIFSIGSILCATAHSVPELIVYRIIQAIGAVGMMVCGFAIVRDRYHGEKSGKTYSYLNGIIAFSPMFAPFVGSYLDVHLGWQSTFLILLLISLWAFLSLFFSLPESLPRNKRIKVDRRIFHEYKTIFTNRVFLNYTLSTAMGLSYLFIFCSISPYIIIQLLRIPELNYGYYFAFMGISFFVGSLLSGYFVGKIGIYKTVVVGFFISLIGGTIMALWYFITGLTINNFIWPMLLIGIGGTFGLGAGSGGAMEPFGDTPGAAAALSGSFRFLFSAILGMVVINKNISSTLPLALPAVLFSLVGLILFLSQRKGLIIIHRK
ncbi:multidrug effflux MFS transporter [Coxiella burnetii]|uniref:multidrug effflux MFS transporter n=1 Tax=Coxiella burnetii TaxID=777 RepID=UPI000593C993|nr:multidrug effflux MFS transporter [Coxiella burnetii]ATN74592.1 MFS transporter [Coxiella burnetii]ATN76497.1 MFS transporter [Coxiella burnetii]ATN78414.1 MFS transporter [Coxiella burnetii]ATN80323.1 MFS transporter [Coxiella burnetii]OYK90699.1 Bcr/CflA family drug resistance efflux transporter [Coxiella burnetii]